MLGKRFSHLQQRFAHWTARYAVDRLRHELFLRTHPEAPWFVPSAIQALDSALKSSDIVLEFGSGRSTTWFARRAKQVISVDHDPEWHGKVAADLAKLGLTNVRQLLCSREGYLSIFSQLGPETIDLVIDDATQRDHVALESLSRLSPGGLLVIDNADRYLPHHSGLESPTAVPVRRRDYASETWKAFGERTRAWRRFWLSTGVWDTVIFVKPGGVVDPTPEAPDVV
jgi:predicted O-methyltransferase YrrM